MKLTPTQLKHLKWLIDHGGSAYIADGHLIASGNESESKIGSTWLYLVAHGLLEGKEGRIVVTDFGRRHADPLSRKR